MARPAWLPAAGHRTVDALEAAGVRVAFDLRNVSPPMVLALPLEMRAEAYCLAEIDVQFSAIAPGPNHADAVDWLWGAVAPILIDSCPVLEAVSFEQYPGIQGEVTGTVAIGHPSPQQEEAAV